MNVNCSKNDIIGMEGLATAVLLVGALGVYGSYRWLQADGNKTAAYALGIFSGGIATLGLAAGVCVEAACK